MRKHLLIVPFLALLLASCGSSGSTTEVACTSYWFETMGACLPQNWQLLDRAELDQRGAPEDVVVGFQATEATSGQFPTVTVTREPLATVVTPEAYSEATIRSVSVLPGYKLIDQKTTKIDDISLPLHVFVAQPVSGEPQRRFYQVSTVVSQNGYTITALAPLTVQSALESEILKITGSVTFVEPVTKS